MKKKMKPEDIDWGRVRRLMRASVRGVGSQSDEDWGLIQAAHKADPERYREENRAIRAEEQRKMNPWSEE